MHECMYLCNLQTIVHKIQLPNIYNSIAWTDILTQAFVLSLYPPPSIIDQHSPLQCHFSLATFTCSRLSFAPSHCLRYLLLLLFQSCIASAPPLPRLSLHLDVRPYLPHTDCLPTDSLHNNDSNVFAMVATKQLTDSELRSLETVERVASCFSLIGAVFIFLTFVASPKFRRPVNRLIFNASWGNTLGNIATLVSLSGPRSGQASHLCQFQAFLIQM